MNERSSNGAGNRIVFRICLRSQIIEEAWFRNRRGMLRKWQICFSKMTPRLRAESTGESITLLRRWMVGLLSSETCCGRPNMRNSVLEGLRDRKLDDIQLDCTIASHSVPQVAEWLQRAFHYCIAASFEYLSIHKNFRWKTFPITTSQRRVCNFRKNVIAMTTDRSITWPHDNEWCDDVHEHTRTVTSWSHMTTLTSHRIRLAVQSPNLSLHLCIVTSSRLFKFICRFIYKN